jgi:hypothetical protein
MKLVQMNLMKVMMTRLAYLPLTNLQLYRENHINNEFNFFLYLIKNVYETIFTLSTQKRSFLCILFLYSITMETIETDLAVESQLKICT